MTIFDYFKANVIAVYYEDKLNAENRAPFLMEYFFPNDKQIGLDLSWIKANSSTPVMLKVSNFDADPTYRDFGGFEKMQTELAFFREGYLIKEKDRQELLRIYSSSNLAGLEELLGRIYDEIFDLIQSASVTREVMRWDLVTTGAIKMTSNGVNLDYDYSLKQEQFVFPSVVWSNASATPISDLLDWKDDAEERHGENIAYVIMNPKDFKKIVNAQSTKTLFEKQYLGVPEKDSVLKYLQDRDVNIVLYKKQYAKKKGAAKQYYLPEGKIIMLPDLKLGKTMFGTTPEEADLLYSNVADVSLVDTGVAITSITHPTPVKIETIVSQVVLPTLQGADYITVADVTKASA